MTNDPSSFPCFQTILNFFDPCSSSRRMHAWDHLLLQLLVSFRIVIALFRAQYKSIQNSQTSQEYIFHILQCFATSLHNFTKFRMLFLAVLLNIPNSKVCLKGESSIVSHVVFVNWRCM